MHRHVLHNGVVREASERLLRPGQVGFLNGWGVFSTIRVLHGVLFAFGRHWARMRHDAALMRVPFPIGLQEMEAALLRLVEANQAHEATLRVAVVRNRGGTWEGPGIESDCDLIAFTTDLTDWGKGVKLAVTRQARHSASAFAGTKILSWSQNLVWLEEAQDRGFDEVILLNEKGQVSECTSANLFISEGSKVWTPPLSSGCLPGVTRDLLLHEVRVAGIEAGERELTLEDLQRADEVFITSTTRELLPALSVEGIRINRDEAVRNSIQAAFTQYEEAYVSQARERGHKRNGSK